MSPITANPATALFLARSRAAEEIARAQAHRAAREARASTGSGRSANRRTGRRWVSWSGLGLPHRGMRPRSA